MRCFRHSILRGRREKVRQLSTGRTMSHIYQLSCFALMFSICWTLRSVASQELHNHPNRAVEGNVGSSYFFYQQPQYPRDCLEARSQCSTSNLSGVYLIKPDGYPEPFEVYCDNTVDSGGWTVIHRFQNDSLLFNRNWSEYKIGFGFLSQEFWIGSDKLSFLTNRNTYELRIHVTSTDNISFYVTYSKFRISDEYSEYKLSSVGEYKGTEDEINRFLCPPNSDESVYISHNCSRRCSCINGHFTCDDTYRCSPYSFCEERNNGSQCYCNDGYKGDGVNCTINTPPSDCQDIYKRSRGSAESGVYKIKPQTWERDPFEVYCNMKDDGEGWTVFQRRMDGAQDFFLYWSDYEQGFGPPDGELWLGNEKLHSLTSQRHYQLRIDFVNRNEAPYHAKYSSFSVGNANEKYALSVGGYSGDAGNYLSYFNGYAFTTRDVDNDISSSGNCATLSWNTCGTTCRLNSGWWYYGCGHSLNAPYGTNCLYWHYLPGSYCNVKYTEMKVRPA